MVPAMRFLHTSDWHLGRSLHRADLRDAQARFLDHLVETARAEGVDAVLVAGDVYDRAVPPVDAVALYEEALVRLRETGARVILISGNHDSARRLGVNSGLIDAAGVYLRTRPGQAGGTGGAERRPRPGRRVRRAVPGAGSGCRTRPPPRPGTPDRRGAGRRPRPPGQRSHATALGRRGPDQRRRGGPGAARTVLMAHAWVAPAGRGAGTARGSRATPSGTSRSAASATSRRRCSTGSATWRSVTCTASRPWPTTCATAARRCPTRSPRRTTEGELAGGARRRRQARGRAGRRPGVQAAEPARAAAWTTCSTSAEHAGHEGTSWR